jgi:hypothetical protein
MADIFVHRHNHQPVLTRTQRDPLVHLVPKLLGNLLAIYPDFQALDADGRISGSRD